MGTPFSGLSTGTRFGMVLTQIKGSPPWVDAVEKVSFLLIASDWRGIEIGESLGGGSGLIVPWVSGNRRARERDEWTKGSKRQGLQVLYDGREKKLVAGTGQPAEPHAFETMVGLEVSKAHLDALAFIPRLSAVSKVQRHFLAQPTLMANAIAVTDQEHPDHQLGIN